MVGMVVYIKHAPAFPRCPGQEACARDGQSRTTGVGLAALCPPVSVGISAARGRSRGPAPRSARRGHSITLARRTLSPAVEGPLNTAPVAYWLPRWPLAFGESWPAAARRPAGAQGPVG